MSLRARLVSFWSRLTVKRILARAEDPEDLRRLMERAARIFLHPPRDTGFDNISLGDDLSLPATRINPSQTRAGPLILYFHGGGYVFGSPRSHRAMLAHLAARTGLSVVLPRYRLAPEHAFPAAPDDALTAYRAIMDHPGGVVLGGDSAGGGLALALLAQICAVGLPQPVGTFCFSPFTDITFSGASFTRNADIDPLLPAHKAREVGEMYLQGGDPTDPRASPLFADFTGAASVWLTASDTEILLDDTRRMAERLLAQGIDVTSRIETGLPHVWPLMHPVLPEAHQTLAKLTEWITSLSRP